MREHDERILPLLIQRIPAFHINLALRACIGESFGAAGVSIGIGDSGNLMRACHSGGFMLGENKSRDEHDNDEQQHGDCLEQDASQFPCASFLLPA